MTSKPVPEIDVDSDRVAGPADRLLRSHRASKQPSRSQRRQRKGAAGGIHKRTNKKMTW